MFKFESKRYPTAPGCYLMKDAKGKVIYVGKAKDLRRRLCSYFQPSRQHRKVKRLAARVDDIEIIIVNNETESLVLENNLIKQHKPRYNRALMDDHTGYAYIVLTGESFPRFLPYRKNRFNKELEGVRGKASERRFGPYVNGSFRDAVLEFITENFQVRICDNLPRRVCFYYHLGRCSGVCESRISPEEYAQAVDQAADLLSHRHTDLIRRMRSKMAEHAEKLEFEKARRIRDQIEALESVLENQIVERDVRHDQDVIYFGESKVLVTKVKRGIVQSLGLFDLDAAMARSEAHERFLLSTYKTGSPKELIVNQLRKLKKVESELASANGYEVRVTRPKTGAEHELLKLCERNYHYRISNAERSEKEIHGQTQ